MFETIVLIFIMGTNTPTTLEDKLGPHETIQSCFYRGADILRSVYSMKWAIIKAEVICIKIERLEKKQLKKEDLMVRSTTYKLL